MGQKTVDKKQHQISHTSKAFIAGAVASFLTQPLDVLKTNMINAPAVSLRHIHRNIIKQGWRQYLRGSHVAVIRQGYGFTIYSTLIDFFNQKLSHTQQINKYGKYTFSAFAAKWIAMFFQAPLTLLKTRLQSISSYSIWNQIKKMGSNPLKQIFRGLNATLIRQTLFSLVHYNIYRFLKDQIFYQKFKIETAFLPSFIASLFALIISQPFQVIRTQISLWQKTSFLDSVRTIMLNKGWVGFFTGLIPRLLRKPINSGICWGVIEQLKQKHID